MSNVFVILFFCFTIKKYQSIVIMSVYHLLLSSADRDTVAHPNTTDFIVHYDEMNTNAPPWMLLPTRKYIRLLHLYLPANTALWDKGYVLVQLFNINAREKNNIVCNRVTRPPVLPAPTGAQFSPRETQFVVPLTDVAVGGTGAQKIAVLRHCNMILDTMFRLDDDIHFRVLDADGIAITSADYGGAGDYAGTYAFDQDPDPDVEDLDLGPPHEQVSALFEITEMNPHLRTDVFKPERDLP
jgi:hypothetical protein